MAKAPLEIKSLARLHTKRAIQVLAGIMDEPDSGAPARVAAANSLLDRGWGKATQPLGGDEDSPLKIIQEIQVKIVDSGIPGP